MLEDGAEGGIFVVWFCCRCENGLIGFYEALHGGLGVRWVSLY